MPQMICHALSMLSNGSQYVTNVARHLLIIFLHLQMRSLYAQLSLVVVEVVDLVVHYSFQAIHDQAAESAHEGSKAAKRT